MSLGTIDRSVPQLFNQGPSALSRLLLFSAMALFLMVADARFHLVQPIRAAISTALYPVQWIVMQPVNMVINVNRYFESLQSAQRGEVLARQTLALQAERVGQAESLERENVRLRALLDLRQKTPVPGRAAEVLYDAADPYTRKIVIDRGKINGVLPGSPVLDEHGLLGQVTQVMPFTSEVTLVVDRELSVPVQNTRSGARSIAFGDAGARGGMELRFMTVNADMIEGDLLATSGVDGVYPAGVPVARIEHIERRADSTFARVYCSPLAAVTSARYVLVLTPVDAVQSAPGTPARPVASKPAASKPAANKPAAKRADKAKGERAR